jgi:hypothetical protein
MNSLSSIFGSYLHPRDTKTNESKISTKYLEWHTKNQLKHLQAKDDTLAWYYGLDALRYSMRFMRTYLCLKTISFVHIFKFRMVLALTYSFGSYTYQELS